MTIYIVEQLRQNDRQTRKTQRELERERGGLERTERQLVSIFCGSKGGSRQSFSI